MVTEGSFTAQRRRPKPGMLALIVLLHVAAIYALARVFAPATTASVERAVLSTVTVTVETRDHTPPPEPEPDPKPDEGAAAEEGRKAVPKPVVAPVPKVVVKPAPPAPRASSTGVADSAGARDTGTGTGAGGAGSGTGSGAGGAGSGAGGGIASQPVHVGGGINNARDYPVPPGGRGARAGMQVVVKVTVGTDGRASNCSVFRPSPDPEADQITCRLVVERLRFRPATDFNGNPVAAPFYWRQRWF